MAPPQAKGGAREHVAQVVHPQRDARIRDEAGERQHEGSGHRVGQNHRRGHCGGGRSVARRERVGIGEVDECEQASRRISRPRPRHRALQNLHEQMRSHIGKQHRQAEARLAQHDQDDPDSERGSRTAEMRDPAHHAGTTAAGRGAGTNASASGRPS
jgi:hypothetical protein